MAEGLPTDVCKGLPWAMWGESANRERVVGSAMIELHFNGTSSCIGATVSFERARGHRPRDHCGLGSGASLWHTVAMGSLACSPIAVLVSLRHVRDVT